jgi:hypothetical protein
MLRRILDETHVGDIAYGRKKIGECIDHLIG